MMICRLMLNLRSGPADGLSFQTTVSRPTQSAVAWGSAYLGNLGEDLDVENVYNSPIYKPGTSLHFYASRDDVDPLWGNSYELGTMPSGRGETQ